MKRGYEEVICDNNNNKLVIDEREVLERDTDDSSVTTDEQINDPWEYLLEGNVDEILETDSPSTPVVSYFFPQHDERNLSNHARAVTPSERVSNTQGYYPQRKHPRYDHENNNYHNRRTMQQRTVHQRFTTPRHHQIGLSPSESRPRSFNFSVDAWRAWLMQRTQQQPCYYRHPTPQVVNETPNRLSQGGAYHHNHFPNVGESFRRYEPSGNKQGGRYLQRHCHHHVTPPRSRMTNRSTVPTFCFPLPPATRKSFYNKY